MSGLHCGAAGSCVSTVGLDEARVRQDHREQEERERRPGEFDFESPVRPRGGLPHVSAPAGGYPKCRPPRGDLLIPRPLAVVACFSCPVA